MSAEAHTPGRGRGSGRQSTRGAMALSSSQHIVLSVSVALCLCFLVPRMMGGGGGGDKEPRRTPHPLHGRPHKESPGKSHVRHGGPQKSFSSMDQIKSAMDQELKNEKTGSGRNLTFALMPMYAVGVALFAAYKFTKMKSKENGKSKSCEGGDKKSEATEKQLFELEQHLSKTEQMLNSLLTQLDPLSNCVNTLAVDQKNEIMNQLQSIRQLMKTSGIDKSTLRNPASQTCNDTLDDLIHSFENQHNIQEEDENEDSQPMEDAHDLATKELPLYASEHSENDADIAENLVLEGLRKRNVKD